MSVQILSSTLERDGDTARQAMIHSLDFPLALFPSLFPFSLLSAPARAWETQWLGARKRQCPDVERRHTVRWEKERVLGSCHGYTVEPLAIQFRFPTPELYRCFCFFTSSSSVPLCPGYGGKYFCSQLLFVRRPWLIDRLILALAIPKRNY